jgi:hypothetical protein
MPEEDCGKATMKKTLFAGGINVAVLGEITIRAAAGAKGFVHREFIP